MAATLVSPGCSSSCAHFNEGPAFLVTPAADPHGQVLEVLQGTPFQTVVPASVSTTGATVADGRVLQTMAVSRHDGRTATLFTALRRGHTTIGVARLTMDVAVVCSSPHGIPGAYRFHP